MIIPLARQACTPGEPFLCFSVQIRWDGLPGSEGCRVTGGGGYYREQIARISQAKRRPRGLSCSEIKPLISIQRKAEEGASRGRGSSSSAPVCFAFHFPALQVDLIKWTGTVHCRRRFPALIKWDLTHQWAHIQSSAVFFENIILVSSFTQTLRCLQTAPQMVPFCEHTDWMPLCKCIFGWLSSPESGRLLCGWHAGLEEKGSALLLTCVCVCLSSQYEFHSLLLLPLSEECTPLSIQYYDSLSLNCFLRGPCSPYLGKLAALPLMHRDGVKFF